MFTLIRDGALEMQADVAERDLLRLAPGQTATLTLSGATAPLTGTVRLVEPTIDTASRLGRVRIVVDAPETVRAGMFAEAAITIAEHEALAVPVTAVGAADGRTTVMKVNGDTVARVEITTGIREGGWVEIVSGLSEGDQIVTKAGAFVRNGDRINPVPAASN
jgi:HlyD family secretion protein